MSVRLSGLAKLTVSISPRLLVLGYASQFTFKMVCRCVKDVWRLAGVYRRRTGGVLCQTRGGGNVASLAAGANAKASLSSLMDKNSRRSLPLLFSSEVALISAGTLNTNYRRDQMLMISFFKDNQSSTESLPT